MRTFSPSKSVLLLSVIDGRYSCQRLVIYRGLLNYFCGGELFCYFSDLQKINEACDEEEWLPFIMFFLLIMTESLAAWRYSDLDIIESTITGYKDYICRKKKPTNSYRSCRKHLENSCLFFYIRSRYLLIGNQQTFLFKTLLLCELCLIKRSFWQSH